MAQGHISHTSQKFHNPNTAYRFSCGKSELFFWLTLRRMHAVRWLTNSGRREEMHAKPILVDEK